MVSSLMYFLLFFSSVSLDKDWLDKVKERGNLSELDETWLNKIKDKCDPADVERLKEELKHENKKKEKNISKSLGKCHIAKDESTPSIYVCMTFSMPDAAWLDLSLELEKIGGVFVVQGLPENSFRSFSLKIQELKKKGLNSSIQINPLLFENHSIKKVPTFLVIDGDKFDKISGYTSLNFALNFLAEKGETSKAKELLTKKGR